MGLFNPAAGIGSTGCGGGRLEQQEEHSRSNTNEPSTEGHFLVAALDRVEARLSAWLTLNPVPTVSAELLRLRQTAEEALGDLSDGVEIESSSLLRRQVARHCVYGVDGNRVAVELARLAI